MIRMFSDVLSAAFVHSAILRDEHGCLGNLLEHRGRSEQLYGEHRRLGSENSADEIQSFCGLLWLMWRASIWFTCALTHNLSFLLVMGAKAPHGKRKGSKGTSCAVVRRSWNADNSKVTILITLGVSSCFQGEWICTEDRSLLMHFRSVLPVGSFCMQTASRRRLNCRGLVLSSPLCSSWYFLSRSRA